jgi:thiamine phosphate synthase YjbQ (UPF0047 family)
MQGEQIKIQQALKIPVSDVIFKDGYVAIYSSHRHIGIIPSTITGSNVQYDTSEDVEKALNWHTVYIENKEQLHNLVVLLFDNPIPEDRITTGPFHKLYIRQDDQSVRTVECLFENGEWNLTLLDF